MEVVLKGPLFDSRAPATFRAIGEDCEREVAQQGYAYVRTNLNASIRNPTPYYETQIVVQKRAGDHVIHDRGIIYGAWLEGVGSRNKTTRFKGYFSFRRARQQLEADVPRICSQVVVRHLAALQ